MSNSLKILQVIDRLDAGGAERVMVDLSNILHKNGHEVTTLAILSHGALGGALNPDIVKIDLNRKFKFSIYKLLKISELCKKHEVIHVHMRHNLKYIYLAKKLFPFQSKIIFHDHFGKINIDQSVGGMLKKALQISSYIGVSKQLCDWAVNDVKLSKNKVFHLPNVVLKQEVNTKFVLDESTMKLVLVSNFRREKNLEFAIDLVKNLSASKAVNLHIYGKVVDAEYFQEIKKKIADLGMKKSIKFVHDCTAIQPVLKQYDLALHTAKSETGPLVLIEYIAQGLPFLTYNTGEVVAQMGVEIPEFVMSDFEVGNWITRIDLIRSRTYSTKLQQIFAIHYSEDNYYKQCMEIYRKSLTY